MKTQLNLFPPPPHTCAALTPSELAKVRRLLASDETRDVGVAVLRGAGAPWHAVLWECFKPHVPTYNSEGMKAYIESTASQVFYEFFLFEINGVGFQFYDMHDDGFSLWIEKLNIDKLDFEKTYEIMAWGEKQFTPQFWNTMRQNLKKFLIKNNHQLESLFK